MKFLYLNISWNCCMNEKIFQFTLHIQLKINILIALIMERYAKSFKHCGK